MSLISTGSKIRTNIWLKQLCSSHCGWWFSVKWIYLWKLINTVINSKRNFRTLSQVHTEKNWLELSKNIPDNGMVRFFVVFSRGGLTCPTCPSLALLWPSAEKGQEGTHRSTTQCRWENSSKHRAGLVTRARTASHQLQKRFVRLQRHFTEDRITLPRELMVWDSPGAGTFFFL